MRRIIAIVATLLATLIMTGCGAAKITPAQQAIVDSKVTMYTQVSMWSEKDRINGTNYSTGMHIPINSKIVISDINSKVIKFEFSGRTFIYYTSTKYTSLDSSSMIERIFSKKAVDLSKYSKDTQENILNGTVVVGMTKDEVLLSRGYPPSSLTLNTESNTWIYMRNRWISAKITFKNNKVSAIKGTVS